MRKTLRTDSMASNSVKSFREKSPPLRSLPLTSSWWLYSISTLLSWRGIIIAWNLHPEDLISHPCTFSVNCQLCILPMVCSKIPIGAVSLCLWRTGRQSTDKRCFLHRNLKVVTICSVLCLCTENRIDNMGAWSRIITRTLGLLLLHTNELHGGNHLNFL